MRNLKRNPRSMWFFLAYCLVGYLLLLFLMQRSVLFPRPGAVATPNLPDGIEVLWLGENEDVEAWLMLPVPSLSQPSSSKPVPVLIFTHGNGELIDYWVDAFEAVRAWGMAALLVEYPGYGRSGGRPSQRSITATLLAAYDVLAADPRIDARRIVAYGRSLGGGAACQLARSRPLAGLILESSFTSVRALARRFALPGFLVLDPFDNLAALAEFDGPVLVIHGDRDQIIPTRHGQELAEAAGTAIRLLPCGHNDCPRPWEEIRAFLLAEGVLRQQAL